MAVLGVDREQDPCPHGAGVTEGETEHKSTLMTGCAIEFQRGTHALTSDVMESKRDGALGLCHRGAQGGPL